MIAGDHPVKPGDDGCFVSRAVIGPGYDKLTGGGN